MNFSVNRLLLSAVACLLIAFGGNVFAGEVFDPDFDWDNDFAGHNPLIIDNAWWPLLVGTSFEYLAETEDECERNIVTVTGNVKNWGDEGETVDDPDYVGISALVVHDIEWADEECEDNWGDPLEETLDWYAQDQFDNIWYLGEYTIAYDHEGECDNWVDENDPPNQGLGCLDGSFQAGVDGAEAGIVMLGSPFKGASYSQEYYEGEAEDMAKILNFVPVSTDFGDWEGCLKTKEWTPLEPGEVEHKFYCMGVGLVLINELKGKTKEVILQIPD